MRDIELPTAYHVATLPVHYPTSPSRTSTVIVMEPVTCFITGAQLLLSLLERIIAKDHYSETEAAHCFIGIEYLHQLGIAHTPTSSLGKCAVCLGGPRCDLEGLRGLRAEQANRYGGAAMIMSLGAAAWLSRLKT